MENILEAHEVVFNDSIRYPLIEIKRDCATFIQGPSGTGKSTLLKLINATATKDSGEILYDGKNTDFVDTISLRREIILVSQSVFLFPKTIEENFEEFYRYRDMKAPDKKTMKEFLNLCAIGDFELDTQCDNMSGGERQRVYLAIAISFMPKIIMLDEPTSALDEKTAEKFMSNVKSFCKDNHITLIVVSHAKSLTDKFADEVINLTGNEVKNCEELSNEGGRA